VAEFWNPTGHTSALDMHVYAHSLRDHPEGIALIAINADRTASQEISIPAESERYTLTARRLLDTAVELNGTELKLKASGDLPQIAGIRTPAGTITLAPASITFLAMPAPQAVTRG